MNIVVKVNGIEQEIDAKNIKVKGITLEQITNRLIKVEKNNATIDEKYKKREQRLINIWDKVRGNK